MKNLNCYVNNRVGDEDLLAISQADFLDRYSVVSLKILDVDDDNLRQDVNLFFDASRKYFPCVFLSKVVRNNAYIYIITHSVSLLNKSLDLIEKYIRCNGHNSFVFLY